MSHTQGPLYILPHDIVVRWENHKGKYVICGILPHRLLHGRKMVERGRLIMTAVLGRKLKRNEHVHHGILGKKNDSIENLELLPAREHHRQHLIGNKRRLGIIHSLDDKAKISNGLKRAYASGRRKKQRLYGKRNPFFGKHHTAEAKEKIRQARLGCKK